MLKFRNDPISMIALNLNPAILDRSTGAQSLFQLCGEFRQVDVVQREVGNGRHPFASSSLGFSANSDDSGLGRGRWLTIAGACGL
jgi:hypothetical protein